MSLLQPIESVQLRDRTFRSIRAAIVAGELAPRQQLRDRVLAETLGVSRTPVREALHRLESEGLVEPRGRSGWVVASFTEQDIREVFELRRVLEPLGLARLSAEPDDAVIAELSGFFAGYERPISTDRYEAYFATDHAFHKRLIECSRNARLQRFYGVIEGHIDRGRHFLSRGSVGRVDETLDEHRAVARAIGDRDFDAARRELVRHLRTGEQRMVDHLRHVHEES
jgi:GntR family transcriptional regulator, rspAB operon transcriptional repressor